MKKGLVLAIFLSLAATAVYAAPYKAAVGGVFGANVLGSMPHSAMLTFRLGKYPPVFALGINIPKEGDASAALIMDWWLIQESLTGMLNFYVGPGLYTSIGNNLFVLGGRVPVGLNIFPIKPLELFLEIAPGITFIAPDGVQIPNFGMQAGFGFRFWF